MTRKLKSAVFLDRDGTIIEDRGHPGSPSDVVFFPETFPALRKLQEYYLLFIVTHQPGIARGIVSAGDVGRVNSYVVSELVQCSAVVPGIRQAAEHILDAAFRRQCESFR